MNTQNKFNKTNTQKPITHSQLVLIFLRGTLQEIHQTKIRRDYDLQRNQPLIGSLTRNSISYINIQHQLLLNGAKRARINNHNLVYTTLGEVFQLKNGRITPEYLHDLISQRINRLTRSECLEQNNIGKTK